jgi:hypothetical protein
MVSGRLRPIDLAGGGERDLAVAEVLEGPERYFDAE